MAAFVLRHPNGTTLNLNSAETKTAVSKAEQTCSFMADDTITINVVSATPLTFYIGDTLDILGTTYTLNQLPTAIKQGSRSFTYTLTLEGVQYELIEATFLLNDNTKLDSFTGTLADFADRIVENANRVAEGEKWVIASVDITEAKTLTYTDQNCLQVLQSICEEWCKKFRIRTENGKRKITIADEVGNPYTPVFRYGEIDGLYKVTREKADDTSVITRLYTYGSSENLGNGYRHNRLCLPAKEKNQSYIQDANKVALFGIKEGVKAFENIRPERVGSVTSIIESDKLSFVDSTMFDLKAKKSNGKDTMYLISGTTAKVTFQTGGLAGYELEIEDYDHSTHEFKLVQFTDSNGDTFPSYDLKAFQIAVGDKYVLSDIMLPDEYIADAESRLQAEARSYYDSYSHPQIKYSIEVLPKWLKANLGSLGTDSLLFYPGDFVNVEDADLGIDGRIRIESITHDLLNTYQYTLNLADNTLPNALQRVIGAITKNQQDIKIENVNNAANLRKAYRVTEELKEMVFDTDGYFTDKIKPSTIETAMLAVGAKSQQFTIKDCLFQANYNSNANSVHVGAGSLHHFGIAEDIKVWNIAEQDITNLVSSRSYYVYAQCNKTTSSASINISTDQRKYDSDSTYYFFLIGTLSSVYKSGVADIGSRALSLTYGSTTINGRFITTGCIQGTNGKLTIDLDNCKIYAEEMEFLGLDQQPQSVASRFNAVDAEVSGVKATTEATAQRFDNLQIGGRNLVLKSTYTEDSPYTLKPISADTYVTVCQAAALTKGKEYTLQCNTDGLWGEHMQAQSSRLCTIWVQYHNADGTTSTKYQCFGGNYPNESGRKTWTFTAQYDCSSSSIRLNVYGNGNPSVNFWHIQLEEGNVATSWSPAPEDLIINVDDTITSVDVEYALSTSTTTAPTSGWQTTAPTWESGKYMWQRTKRTLKNGTSSYSNPTCIQGARGTDGANGKDGANGSNGISITKVEEQYQLHTSATTAPTGTWSGSVIYPIPDGKYLWYRNKITYSNNTVTYTTPIVDNALIVANNAEGTATAAQTAANAAKTAATNAETKAANAAAAAKTANDSLSDYANDGKVSPTEKRALSSQKSEIEAEYNDITKDADKYNLKADAAFTAFTTAKTKAITALNKYTSTATAHITIGSDYGDIAAYYTARTTILDKIAAAAKKVATDAQNAADKAQSDLNSIGGRNYAATLSSVTDITGGTGAKNYLVIDGRLRFEEDGSIVFTNPNGGGGGFHFPIHSSMSECIGGPMIITIEYTQKANYALGFFLANKNYTKISNINLVNISGNRVKQSYKIANAVEFDRLAISGFTWWKGDQSLTIHSIMVERGSVATPYQLAPEDLEARISEADYLKECLPPGGSTETIGGGLLLTSILGVRNAAGQVTAGLNGSSGDASDNTPMIWAGSQGAQDIGNSTFRVYPNGHVDLRDVSIFGDTSDGSLNIDGGAMNLKSSGSLVALNAKDISSYTMDTTVDYHGTKLATISTAAKTFTYSVSTDITESTSGGEVTPFSYVMPKDSSLSGYYKLDMKFEWTIKANASKVKTLEISYGNNSTRSNNYIAGTSGTTMLVGYVSRSYSTAQTANIGVAFTVRITANSGSNLNGVAATLKVTPLATSVMTSTIVSKQIASLIAPNGILLKKDSTHYFGILCNQTDLFHVENGNKKIVFNATNGLLLNGYRANPLVRIVRIVPSGNTVNVTDVYNPLGKASMSISRIERGKYGLTHNLKLGTSGTSTDYTISGTSYTDSQRAYVTYSNKTSTYCVIHANQDHLMQDFPIEIHFFDYSLY